MIFLKATYLKNHLRYGSLFFQVTSDDFRGPVSRLKEYVSRVIRDGRFIEPKGILPANYW